MANVSNGTYRTNDGTSKCLLPLFPKKIPEAISRYQNECRRLFEVLDKELSKNQWLAKDFSIADLSIWCWSQDL